MKLILLFIFFISSANVLAAEVEAELDPREPVAGETFSLNFTIETTDRDEPYISFDPGKAEVQGRRNIGTSVQTTIINGAVETKRITRYTYDLIVPDPGRLLIREIKVEINDTEYEVEDIKATVLREAKAAKNYFLKAELPKEELYIGEGASLNYYLYFRIPVVGTEVREFPDLNNFIKRFHMPPERVETVEHEGTLYRRKLIYSARVYPESSGELEIDPLRIRLQYSMESSDNSPFSNFGFSSRQTQVRNLQSPPVKVMVKELPTSNMPSEFTGLVGEHDFKLSSQRSRYLTNEPIELRLEVSGPGALENFGTPTLFQSPSLEEFDTKSEFSEIDKVEALKRFDYTFLARSPVSLEERVQRFYYFDPDSEEYKYKEVDIPSLEVVSSGVAPTERENMNEDEAPTRQQVVATDLPRSFLAPFWNPLAIYDFKRAPYFVVNTVLILCILFFIFQIARTQYLCLVPGNHYRRFYETIKKEGLSYRAIFNLFDEFRIQTNQTSKKVEQVIDSLELKDEERAYFKSLIYQAEKGSFKDHQEVLSLKLNKKFFEKLIRELQRVHNEGHTQS